MDKKQNNKNIPSHRQIGALALLGFALCYTGASTDDARDAATPAQREHIAGPVATLTMEGAGILCLIGAGVLLKKRQKQR